MGGESLFFRGWSIIWSKNEPPKINKTTIKINKNIILNAIIITSRFNLSHGFIKNFKNGPLEYMI